MVGKGSGRNEKTHHPVSIWRVQSNPDWKRPRWDSKNLLHKRRKKIWVLVSGNQEIEQKVEPYHRVAWIPAHPSHKDLQYGASRGKKVDLGSWKWIKYHRRSAKLVAICPEEHRTAGIAG